MKAKIAHLRCTRGAVALEFALLIPVLLIMLLGAIDFGMVINEKMKLASAARSGVQFAVQNTANAQDAAAIQLAVTNASGLDPADFTITSLQFCECAEGAVVACDGSCAIGTPRVAVTVTVQENFQTLFTYPGIANPYPLSEQTTMRVQ
ncbi:MAG: TadE/TadG family type IV pilus assembly protein [Phycisphaerae bacterium]